MSRDEHIEFCERQAAICREAACDESLSAPERLRAARGEADWLAEKVWLEAQQ